VGRAGWWPLRPDVAEHGLRRRRHAAAAALLVVRMEGLAPYVANACMFCGQAVTGNDEQAPFPILDFRTGEAVPLHSECGLRLVVGSVGHIHRKCSCFVTGSTYTDPPGLTARQAARAAVVAWSAARGDDSL
jgi:hypothetical protein